MSGFEIDHRAFRSKNIGRPPQHLIREAVQNAFDENPDHVRIEIKAASGRGLKELIAVCSTATIETANRKTTFVWTGNGHDAVFWAEVERMSGEVFEARNRTGSGRRACFG